MTDPLPAALRQDVVTVRGEDAVHYPFVEVDEPLKNQLLKLLERKGLTSQSDFHTDNLPRLADRNPELLRHVFVRKGLTPAREEAALKHYLRSLRASGTFAAGHTLMFARDDEQAFTFFSPEVKKDALKRLSSQGRVNLFSTGHSFASDAEIKAGKFYATLDPENPYTPEALQSDEPPLSLLGHLRDLPGLAGFGQFIYENMAQLFAEQKDTLPPWAFLHSKHALFLFEDTFAANGMALSQPDQLLWPLVYTALSAWRLTKGIYRFDPDVFKSLTTANVDGEMPGAMLKQLPEWCVYIKTHGLPFLGRPSHGFFASCEQDQSGLARMNLLFVHAGTLAPAYVRLSGTLEQMWDESQLFDLGLNNGEPGPSAEVAPTPLDRAFRDRVKRDLQPVLSLVLYLCSVNAEVLNKARHGAEPKKPKATRNSRGVALRPQGGVQVWDVGLRLGAALRRGSEHGQGQDSGRTLKPHIRGAHWKRYWYGSKADPSQRRQEWLFLAPTGVNIPEGMGLDDLPAVVRKVGSKSPSTV